MTSVIEKYNVFFWNFVNKYDLSSTNLLRKVIHCFLVAENSFNLACQQKLNKKQRELAYLIGLMHDIGRFEQWKLYQTFNDHLSKDHGLLGSDILSKISLDAFNITKKEKDLLINVVKYHTQKIENKDKTFMLFFTILQDADNYSNLSTIANGAMPVWNFEDGVTAEILAGFHNKEYLRGFSPKTKLDRALMCTADAYYIKSKWLKEQVLQKNMLDVMRERFDDVLSETDKKTYKKALDFLKNNLL